MPEALSSAQKIVTRLRKTLLYQTQVCKAGGLSGLVSEERGRIPWAEVLNVGVLLAWENHRKEVRSDVCLRKVCRQRQPRESRQRGCGRP